MHTQDLDRAAYGHLVTRIEYLEATVLGPDGRGFKNKYKIIIFSTTIVCFKNKYRK